MKKVKRIWSMATSGLADGNVTEYAEFNVYADPESYDILLKSGIPITVIGLDMCLKDSSLNKEDLSTLSKIGYKGEFVEKCTSKILEHNIKKFGLYCADIPDAVAVSCCLWPDTVISKRKALMECHTKPDERYGEVTVDFSSDKANAELITEFNSSLFKEKLLDSLK